MDNAVKALIIAGAVLIAILLIGVGIMVFNAANDPLQQAQSSSEQQAVQMFNEPFNSYLGTNQSAQQAKGIISAINASNAKNPDHQITFGTGTNTKSKVSQISNKKHYKIEEEIGTDENNKGYITTITIREL